jgi:hypothetical protein
MIRVLLVDGEGDNTLTVFCPDMDKAEKLGRAAIYSDGGVSAYKVGAPIHFMPELIQWLRSGFSVAEIRTALDDLHNVMGSDSEQGGE